jgi:hypothetical protein
MAATANVKRFVVCSIQILAKLFVGISQDDNKAKMNMDKDNRFFKWSTYLVILVIASAFAGVAHEFGHFISATALGYHPRINFSAGRVEIYDVNGNLIPNQVPTEKIIFSAGGPAMTLLLAASFAVLYSRHRDSFLLFGFAITNAVSRLNMFIDGFNSDEGNISEILLKLLGNQSVFLVPLTVWTISIGLSCLLVRRQEFFKKTHWLIPAFLVITAISIILSFKMMGFVFS